MRNLSRAARVDDVELRGDLIRRAEPGFAYERDQRVAVIGGEDGRVAQTELLERIPDAVVGAGLGEMIAAADVASALFLDDRPKMSVGRVDRARVGERVANGDDAGSVGQRLDPFGHDFLAGLGRRSSGAYFEAVVNGHVRCDVGGERVVGVVGRPLDASPERVEIASLLGQPDAIVSQPLQVVVLHGVPPTALSREPLYSGEGFGTDARDRYGLKARAARPSFRRHAQDRGGSFYGGPDRVVEAPSRPRRPYRRRKRPIARREV